MSSKVDGADCDEVLPPGSRILDSIARCRGVWNHDVGPRFRVAGVAVPDADDPVADVVTRETNGLVGKWSSPSETNRRRKDFDCEGIDCTRRIWTPQRERERGRIKCNIGLRVSNCKSDSQAVLKLTQYTTQAPPRWRLTYWIDLPSIRLHLN